MKVVLKAEVDSLGLAGDIVEVRDGFGRNFLLPRGLAIIATKGALKEAEALTRARKAREAETIGDANTFKDILEDITLRIPARVDEFGHLYGSVAAQDVVDVLNARGHKIEKRRVDLKRSIKQIGEYEVPVRVHNQVEAIVKVEVVDVEGKVTLDTPPPEVPPLPSEMGEVSRDGAMEPAGAEVGGSADADQPKSIEEQALEAAAQVEADEAANTDEQQDPEESNASESADPPPDGG